MPVKGNEYPLDTILRFTLIDWKTLLKRRRPSKIFVCDCGDLWGEWVPNEWIEEVLKVVKKCPQHTFQFLTKNPQRYLDFEPLPDNSWAGTTVTSNKDHGRAIDHEESESPCEVSMHRAFARRSRFSLRWYPMDHHRGPDW